jgi:hypothetical protein
MITKNQSRLNKAGHVMRAIIESLVERSQQKRKLSRVAVNQALLGVQSLDHYSAKYTKGQQRASTNASTGITQRHDTERGL